MNKILLIVLILVLNCVKAFSQDCDKELPSYYAKSLVYIYQHSKTTSAIKGEIPKGAEVKIVSSYHSSFWKVCYNGNTGYVEKSKLSYTEVSTNASDTQNSTNNDSSEVKNENIKTEPKPINRDITVDSISFFEYKGLLKCNVYVKKPESMGTVSFHYKINDESFKVTSVSFANDRIYTDIRIAEIFSIGGRQEVSFEIVSFKDNYNIDTQGNYDPKVELYNIKGDSIKTAWMNIPPIKRFQVRLKEITVDKRDQDGEEWDFNMFAREESDKYPDLIYTVSSHGYINKLYTSSSVRNAVYAEFKGFSSKIKYVEGEELHFCVWDKDLAIHDKIGCFEIKEKYMNHSISVTEQEKIKSAIVTFKQKDKKKRY